MDIPTFLVIVVILAMGFGLARINSGQEKNTDWKQDQDNLVVRRK